MTAQRMRVWNTGRPLSAGVRPVFMAIVSLVGGFLTVDAFGDPGHHHHDDRFEWTSTLADARMLQQAHRFDDAATVLAEYLETSPLDVEAQLLHADVLRHAHRHDESRDACVRVAVAGSSTLAAYCAVQVLIADGQFERADEISLQFAKHRSLLPDAAYQWTLEVAAEAAWRNGRIGTAQRLYRSALAFERVPHSTRDAYAQLLDSIDE